MDEELRLRLSLLDGISGPFKNVMQTIGAARTAAGGLDKVINRLDDAMAKAGASAGLFGAGIKAQGSAIGSTAARLREYEATVKRLGNKNGQITNLGSQYRGAGGKIMSIGDVQKYREAASWTQTLNENQTRLAATQDRLNRKDLSKDLLRGQIAYTKQTLAASQASTALARAAHHATTPIGKLESKFTRLANTSPSIRYALYDVSASLAIAGAAMVAAGLASGAMAVSFERSFADVERTTNLGAESTKRLRADFVGLAQELPVTFGKLTQIGALGAQLGISSGGLTKFTEVVAQLTTTTDLSAEAAGTALGRFRALGIVTEKEFSNLGSAILKVGINSVATESQIVNVATQISSMADFAGLGAQEIVGLAGALASVAAKPELARGLVTRLFTNMSEAVAEGGHNLDNFAKIAGVSSAKFAQAWGTPAFGNVFLSFMKGIQNEGGNAVATLHELGIRSVRDVPLLLRLAGAFDTAGEAGGLLAETFGDARSGWEDNTELAGQYAKVAGTVAERLKLLMSNFQVLLDAIGSNAIPLFNLLIDAGIQTAQMLTDLANNPFGAWVVGLLVSLVALVGVFALIGAGAARGYASLIALGNALGATTAVAGTGTVSFSALNASMIATGGAARVAAIGVALLGAALKTAAVAGLALIAIGVTSWVLGVAEDVTGISSSVEEMSKAAGKGAGALGNLLNADTGDWAAKGSTELDKFAYTVVRYRNSLGDLADLSGDMNIESGDIIGKIRDLDQVLAAMVESGNTQEAAAIFSVFADENKRLGFDVSNVNKLFPTYTGLVDEAGNVTVTAAEKAQMHAEAIELATAAMEKEAQALADAADSFVTHDGLITKNIEGQKKIAQATADRFNDDKKNKDAAEKSWEDYYDGRTIDFDQYLKDMEAEVKGQEKWQQEILALVGKVPEGLVHELEKLGPAGAELTHALSVATEPELKKYVDLWGRSGGDAALAFAANLMLKEENLKQVATQIGKSSGSAARERFLKDVAAGRLPFAAILAKYNVDAQGNPIKIAADPAPAYKTTRGYIAWVARQKAQLAVYADVKNMQALHNVLAGRNLSISGGGGPNGDFATGGYTGPGAKFAPAGLVHKDEFVFDKESTNRIGVQELYRIMRGQKNSRGYASGGHVGAPATQGSGFSTLDASALQAIMALANRPIYLYTNDKTIAESASRGNSELAHRGTN